MTAKAIADAVFGIEARVLGLGWRRDGVDLWPLYRNEVRGRLSISLLESAPWSAARPRLEQIVDGLTSAPPRGAGGVTVLLNDGFSRQVIAGRPADRLCTPLAVGLERLGLPVLLLDQNSPADPALADRVFGVGGVVRRAKIRGVVRARLGVDAWTQGRCRAILEAAEALGLDPSAIPTARDMAARQEAMLALARRFERILRTVGACRVLIVDFYSVAGFAMVLAAHRAGIPALDVQHGVIDPKHTAYVGWPPRSAEEESLLPDGGWTWSEEDARIVRAGLDVPDEQVISGGHPLVAAWRAGWLDGAAEARSEAAGLRAARPGVVHALVTLQPGLMTEEALAPLLQAMRCGGEKVFWWLRDHPQVRADAATLDVLHSTGAAFAADLPSRVPLYAALEQVDVHLTHSSSTVVEAEAFGVPSLLWSDYGRESFPNQLARGTARMGENGEVLIQAVLSSPAAGRSKDEHSAADRLIKALNALPGCRG